VVRDNYTEQRQAAQDQGYRPWLGVEISEASAISSNNKLKLIFPKFDGLCLDTQIPPPVARRDGEWAILHCDFGPQCAEARYHLRQG
jgi:hypothetical protein